MVSGKLKKGNQSSLIRIHHSGPYSEKKSRWALTQFVATSNLFGRCAGVHSWPRCKCVYALLCFNHISPSIFSNKNLLIVDYCNHYTAGIYESSLLWCDTRSSSNYVLSPYLLRFRIAAPYFSNTKGTGTSKSVQAAKTVDAIRGSN